MKTKIFLRKVVEAFVFAMVFLVPICMVGSLDSLEEVKKNWPELRCNPANFIYYPLVSQNMSEDVNACIQNTMRGSMGKMLQPLTYVYQLLGDLGGQLNSQLQDVREMFNFVRNAVTSIVQSIFGIFVNLVIQFQKTLMTLQDIIGKIVGTFTSLLYMLDGSVMLMESGWNGTPGQMVRAMGNVKIGNCFANETLVQKIDGSYVRMDTIQLGDVLVNGSKVVATMQISNHLHEPFYRIPKKRNYFEETKSSSHPFEPYIYVTGTHPIYEREKKKFVSVEKFSDAILTNRKDETLTCLITDNHLLPIDEFLFFDWEDQLLPEEFVER